MSAGNIQAISSTLSELAGLWFQESREEIDLNLERQETIRMHGKLALSLLDSYKAVVNSFSPENDSSQELTAEEDDILDNADEIAEAELRIIGDWIYDRRDSLALVDTSEVPQQCFLAYQTLIRLTSIKWNIVEQATGIEDPCLYEEDPVMTAEYALMVWMIRAFVEGRVSVKEAVAA